MVVNGKIRIGKYGRRMEKYKSYNIVSQLKVLYKPWLEFRKNRLIKIALLLYH